MYVLSTLYAHKCDGFPMLFNITYWYFVGWFFSQGIAIVA